jgi:SAM-dependent methyltransferase
VKKAIAEAEYVHGYSEKENSRLSDQAGTLAQLLHDDTSYPAGCRVLEAGCGVGAQTVFLAAKSLGTRFMSVDISFASIAKARRFLWRQGISNVDWQVADIFHLPFEKEAFDHVFVCFTLEHLKDPVGALAALRSVLAPGGTITVIEGDHGSTYFHPESRDALQAIQCLVDMQSRTGGNALIGRQLFPLLQQAGFKDVSVSPRMVYVDESRPALMDGFTKKTFIAMVEGVREQALAAGLMDEETWEKGIRDLYRTTAPDGTFCYTFFKGVARK